MSLETLNVIMVNLLNEATHIWESSGRVLPTLWSIGEGRANFGQPIEDDSETFVPAQIMIHALMARSLDAKYVGRIDEAFTQERDTDDEPEEGELRARIETDPTVRTAICVEGLDIETKQTIMHAATLEMSDDGQPGWYVTVYEDNDSPISMSLHQAYDMSQQMVHSMTANQVSDFSHNLRWVVVDSDADWTKEWD